MELSGFDEEVGVVDIGLSSEVVVVNPASFGCNDDDVRKLILFGSNGVASTVKLFTFSVLALYDLISS